MKRSVNLIIPKIEDTPYMRKTKIILPVIAGVLFAVYLLLFAALFIYSQFNMTQYLDLKLEVTALEKQINNRKSDEGVYAISLDKAGILNNVMKKNSNFDTSLETIEELQTEGIFISNVSLDKKGLTSFSMTASSSAALSDFVDNLLQRSTQAKMDGLTATGISMGSDKKYRVTITYTGKMDNYQ